MADQEIPADVRRLMHLHVETYAQLEILSRLASDCDRQWTLEDLATELEIPIASAREALDHLVRSGLIVEEARGGNPLIGCAQDSAVLRLLQQLSDAYKVNRLDVVNLMNANALERLQTTAMHAFARAFLLGSKEDG